MLSDILERHGYTVLHFEANTDVSIAKGAAHIASQVQNILVGDDTDLLIHSLLIPPSGCDIYFHP